MQYLTTISQAIIGLTVLNVWVLRPAKPTEWRGGAATTLKEEFEAYGLGGLSMGFVGFFKVLLAAMLLAGIWFPDLTKPAAIGIAIFMLGAVAMHVKIGDPAKKSLPALSLFLLAVVTVVF